MVHGIARYRQARADVAPEKIVLLLLREAVSRLARLEDAGGDSSRWISDLHHVRCILIELSEALDPAAAPELVANLAGLYRFCTNQLIEAGRQRTPESVAPARRVLAQLLEGWESALADPPRAA